MKKAMVFFILFLLICLPHGKNLYQRPDPMMETFLFLKQKLKIKSERLIYTTKTLLEESKKEDIDYRLVLALMKVESDFNPHAVSEHGARGLLQVKPSLASQIVKDLEVEWSGPKILNEPEKNIKIGIHVLSSLIEEFKDLKLALTAYNMGPTRLKNLLKYRNISESLFSKKVLDEYQKNILLLPEHK